MKMVLPLLLIGASLSACGARRADIDFPVADSLSAETTTPCPSLEAVTGQLGDLVAKDTTAAFEYARCRARAKAAVAAYQALQARLSEAAAKASKIKE